MYRANYPVYNSSDFWEISLCNVFLDHLVEEISKRVVNKEEPFWEHLIQTLQVF